MYKMYKEKGNCLECDKQRFKKGGQNKWIQKATKGMRKDKPCTGKKFGGPSCPPGTKRYELAKVFREMAAKRKKEMGGESAPMNMAEDIGKQNINYFKGALKNYASNANQEIAMQNAMMQDQMMMNQGGNIFGMSNKADANLSSWQDAYVSHSKNKPKLLDSAYNLAVDMDESILAADAYNTLYGPESNSITKTKLNRGQIRKDMKSDDEELATSASNFMDNFKDIRKQNRKASRQIFMDKINPFSPDPTVPTYNPAFSDAYDTDVFAFTSAQYGGQSNNINTNTMNYFNTGGSTSEDQVANAIMQQSGMSKEELVSKVQDDPGWWSNFVKSFTETTGISPQDVQNAFTKVAALATYPQRRMYNTLTGAPGKTNMLEFGTSTPSGNFRFEGGNTGMTEEEFMKMQGNKRYGGQMFEAGGAYEMGPSSMPIYETGGGYPLYRGKEMTESQKTFHDRAMKRGMVFDGSGYSKPNTNASINKGTGFVSYGSNPDYIDNRAVYVQGDPARNMTVRQALYSGKYEYNPETDELRELPKDKQVTVPTETLALLNNDQDNFDYTTLNQPNFTVDTKTYNAPSGSSSTTNTATNTNPNTGGGNTVTNQVESTEDILNNSGNTNQEVTTTDDGPRGNVVNDGTQGGVTTTTTNTTPGGNVQQSNIYAPGPQIGYAGVPVMGGSNLMPGMRMKNHYVPGGYGVAPVMYNADQTVLRTYMNKNKGRGLFSGPKSKTKMTFDHRMTGSPLTQKPSPDQMMLNTTQGQKVQDGTIQDAEIVDENVVNTENVAGTGEDKVTYNNPDANTPTNPNEAQNIEANPNMGGEGTSQERMEEITLNEETEETTGTPPEVEQPEGSYIVSSSEVIDDIVENENNPNTTGNNQNVLQGTPTGGSGMGAMETEDDLMNDLTEELNTGNTESTTTTTGGDNYEMSEAEEYMLGNQDNRVTNAPKGSYDWYNETTGDNQNVVTPTGSAAPVEQADPNLTVGQQKNDAMGNMTNEDYMNQVAPKLLGGQANVRPLKRKMTGYVYGYGGENKEVMYNMGGNLDALHNELKALDARKNEIQSMITNTQFEQGSAQLPTSNIPMAGSGYEVKAGKLSYRYGGPKGEDAYLARRDAAIKASMAQQDMKHGGAHYYDYEMGGEYYLTDSDIQAIRDMGGEIEIIE